MAKLTIDGREVEAADGAPLVEVIKNAGTFISNLCYINGRPPYAGCRTCLVEIEGARGLQLSCTTAVSEGMVVRTDSQVVKDARQATLSLILSYHSDRCLTCHREVKCMPGDTCLRDNVVTHRCVTCSKNYRCELQTTCEMLEMAGYEPWEGEARTYYQTEQPAPDRGNPFLEFDPQMCIICTRCVRVCDEIRHTGAITLAGRGFDSRIAFGAGGAVHESNCDFCGSCIDLCPTAALMEHPNKWSATQTERWVPTTCTHCSVGCTINLGVKKGRGVIVRPDPAGNPVSLDQLCVRGRYHYDAVKARDRLSQPLLRRNGAQEAVSWQEALEHTVERLAAIRQQYGPDAIAFLGSPLTTNEENYLLQKLARAIVGTNNVDSSAGPMTRAVSEALRGAFGSEILPADMTRLAGSKTLLVVADDLESSHNVAALRIKDAVVREGARLIVVSPHWGELCDFAEVWLQPRPGEEQAVLVSLLQALLITSEEVKQRVEREAGLSARLAGEVPELSEQSRRSLARARDILIDAVRDGGQQQLSFVMAMPHLGEGYAGAVTTALANLAIACLGEGAPAAFFALPQESNVWGMRDVGVDPQLLPGYRKAGDGAARTDLERSWGAVLPASQGLSFREMLARCGDGLKALVVLNDNPMFAAAEKTAVKEALSKLDFLAVIDSLHTDTAQLAEAVLSDTGIYGKEGTVTNADRRVLRLHSATAPEGEAQPAWRILGDLGQRLAARLQTAEVRINFRDPAEIMEEMAELIPLYRECRYPEMENGRQQHMEGIAAGQARLQAASAIKAGDSSGFLLSSGRTLYISYEGAAIHSAEADKIHRDEFIEINPADAKRLGIGNGTRVTLRNSRGELSLPAKLTEAVQPGMLYVPLFHDGGATAALFAEGEAYTSVDVLLAG